MCKSNLLPIPVVALMLLLAACDDGERAVTAQAQPPATQSSEKRGAVDKPAPTSRLSTAKEPDWRFLPLCEINRLDMPQFYAAALPGVRAWAQVTDTIGVITARMPETYRQLWPRLQHDVPGVKFVPGLKLSGHPSHPVHIDDPAVWRSLAEAVRVSCELTGSSVCLLDTESGLNPYLKGEYEPDWDRVEELMRTLPDVTYYLYPAVRGIGELREKTGHWVRTFLKAKPDTVLVSTGWSTRVTPEKRLYQTVQQLNASLAPCIDICYAYELAKRPNDWGPENLPRLLAGCPRPFIVYGWGLNPRNAQRLAAVMGVLERVRRGAEPGADLRERYEDALRQAQARGAIPE